MWFPVCTIRNKSRAWSQYSDFTLAKDLPISVKIEWFFAETTDFLINLFIYILSIKTQFLILHQQSKNQYFLLTICSQKCWLFVNIYFGTSKESHFEKEKKMRSISSIEFDVWAYIFFYACCLTRVNFYWRITDATV